MTKWVIVANSERCRVFAQEEGGRALREKDDWVHPASRLHDSQVMSDHPGSDHGSFGQGRHPMPGKTDPKVHEQEAFAHEVCGQLEQWRKQEEFDRLVLIAPPTFLGRLRSAMSKEMQKMVVAEVDRDLTTCSVAEVQEYLGKAS